MATEKNAKKTTEVATTGGYGEIANMNFLSDAMDDDCAGLDFQSERIKLPSGGMTAFEVSAGDGEYMDLAKKIEGVIIYNHPVNSYYLEAYKGGNNPLDCGSFGGICGTGNPGGNCKTCRFNQFGSGIMIPVAHKIGKNIDPIEFGAWLKDFLTNPNITKIAHNLAFESMFSYAIDSFLLS